MTDASKQVKLGSLSGLVPKEKAMAFERILFRATRGNIFLRQESVDEPVATKLNNGKFVGRRRWVEYAEKGLYNASRVPPEWHG